MRKNTNVRIFKIGCVMKKLLYLEEHVSCREYSPNILVGFKHRILNEENDLREQDRDYHHLIFFWKEKLSFVVMNREIR